MPQLQELVGRTITTINTSDDNNQIFMGDASLTVFAPVDTYKSGALADLSAICGHKIIDVVFSEASIDIVIDSDTHVIVNTAESVQDSPEILVFREPGQPFIVL